MCVSIMEEVGKKKKEREITMLRLELILSYETNDNIANALTTGRV